jgi:hypothetical protein
MGSDVQTCIAEQACVRFNEGFVCTTLDGGDKTFWSQNDFPGGRPMSAACIPGRTNPAVCVVTTSEFLWLGTMTESGGDINWSWHSIHAPPHKKLEAVGCSSGGECTAVGDGGEVFRSVPGTNLMHWEKLVLPDLPRLTSVDCPANGVCLAGGLQGANAIIASTTDNWAEFSINLIPGFEGKPPKIKSLSCETVNRCVAVGDTPALVGLRKIGAPSCGCSRRACSKSRHHRKPRRRCLRSE